MRRRLRLDRSAATPDLADVLESQGIAGGSDVPPRVVALLEEALTLYISLAAPVGIQAEVRRDEFLEIYRGEGRNANRTPLEGIAREGFHLALFAITVGGEVSDEVGRLFKVGDPALAYALDNVASIGVEKLAGGVARQWEVELQQRGAIRECDRVLPYSPGYCGWDVSGQRRLFAALRPEEVGISLNASCLMRPLKSVSGVLVAAEGDAHAFDIDFPFCVACATQSCRERIHSVTMPMSGGM